MRKQNVFLVSGRQSISDGDPRGAVVNFLVCSVDDDAVRRFLEQTIPEFAIFSVTSLVMLEETARKIKAVLAGEDTCWQVLTDPVLEVLAAA